MTRTLSFGLVASCAVALLSLHPTAADFKYERSIAFSVERTKALGTSADQRDIGGFNKNSRNIYLNIGEAVDMSTGQFKAPMDGIYAFHYSFSSTVTGGTTRVELLKLKVGKDIEHAVSLVNQTLVPSISDPLDYASASVIVDLDRSDRVFMRLGPGVLDATRDRPLLYTGYMVYRIGNHLYSR